MPKTKAEVAKMVRAQKIKQFSKLTLEQRKIKNGEIMRSARRNTAVGKIELSVLKKLILPEQKANKARTELKKTVPTTKKKVSRAELDKARVALQKKPVPKGSHRMPDGSIMKDSAMPKKKPAPKKTPAPTIDSLQEVMAVMTDVAKDKGKSSQKQIDTELGNKFDPLNTRPLPVNNWTPVKIFTDRGTGKGKVYEAYFKKNFTNEHRRLKPNPYQMGTQASMDWGSGAANYTKWEDMKSSVIIIRDVKSKNFIGGIHLAGSTDKSSDVKYEAPRRHFRFENNDAFVKDFPRKKGIMGYDFPPVVAQDLMMAPSSVQKYYGYDEDKLYTGEDQEHESPNDSIRKMKFKPVVKDINELYFKISRRY